VNLIAAPAVAFGAFDAEHVELALDVTEDEMTGAAPALDLVWTARMMLSTELIPQGQNGGNDPIEDDKGARLYRQPPLILGRNRQRDHPGSGRCLLGIRHYECCAQRNYGASDKKLHEAQFRLSMAIQYAPTV